MKHENIRIIKLSDLPQGGFAGIVEKQMVMSPKLWTKALERDDISHGLDGFVYLATGYFKPHDGASLHPHQNIDIVTLVLSGSVSHHGTLGDGTTVYASQVQVQRAGTGMRHAEVNKGEEEAQFVQLWFLPPEQNLEPAYQNIDIKSRGLTTVLGNAECERCFGNGMTCQIGTIFEGHSLEYEADAIIFITSGKAMIGDKKVGEGDLIEATRFKMDALSEVGLVFIHHS